jgi:O-succinylbenzoic acid--CoA ligase
LTWAAVQHAADAAVSLLHLDAQTTWLGCLPLDHIGGARVVLRAGRGGNRIVLHERFDAEVVTRAIDDGEVHGLSVVPTMLHRLLAARGDRAWPPALRCLLTGGGPLSGDDIARATALGLAPSQTYGLTEAASQVCTLLPHEAAAHPGTAGRPLPGMQVRITDGVIAVRGPALFAGYERDGELAEALSADGWFDTGDLGTLDADGYLTVQGRRSDLILSGGENVYPAEVEAVLERHPLVAEAGVFGVSDPEWGQVVAAVLVARGAPPDDAAFAAWLAANLAGFKRPRRWRWADALPRTTTGKLQRQRLDGAWEIPPSAKLPA